MGGVVDDGLPVGWERAQCCAKRVVAYDKIPGRGQNAKVCNLETEKVTFILLVVVGFQLEKAQERDMWKH